MPPMGPFLDTAFWVGLVFALLYVFRRHRVAAADGGIDLRSSGRAALLSLADVVGRPSDDRNVWRASPGASFPSKDALQHWCASEMNRLEDERRRLDLRHRELTDMIDRVHADKGATTNSAEVV